MQLPLQITFRHMDSSDAVAARIRERSEELERFFDRIVSCRVVVECRHPRRHQGNLFRVRVDLKVPGGEIVVGRDPRAHHAHEDVYVAIRDAFDARDAATSSCTRCPTTGGSRGSCPRRIAASF